MSRSTSFRLRWKGSVTGPFPLQRINEMLRAGEISLVHSIETDSGWLTVRDYLRTTGQNRPSVLPDTGEPGDTAVTSASGEDFHGPLENHPDNYRNAAGASLERIVREGYLWCGSTFIFPLVFAIPAAVFINFSRTGTNAKVIIFTFTTTAGCLLPIYFVRKVGRLLDQEGLGEIRQAQFNLVALLTCFGLILWGLGCLWYLNN